MPLHPQAQQFVDQLAESDGPDWCEMTPVEAREVFASLTELFGSGPELHNVEDRQLNSGVAIRIYRPVANPGLPVVMYFHGGGWVLGDIETHDSLCRRLATESECVVVAVDHRPGPESMHPGPLDDCCEAFAYIIKHADELSVDGTRIVVAGDSAGANLAAAVAIRSRDENGPPIKSQVLIYPVVKPDFETASYTEFASGFGLTRNSMRWFWDQHADEKTRDEPTATLTNANLQDLPPTCVITAEYDVLRDEGEQLVVQLNDAGVTTTHKRYDGMIHGFVHLGGVFDDSASAVSGIGAFVRDSLKHS